MSAPAGTSLADVIARIGQAEQAWRLAYEALDDSADPSDALITAEQDTWDALIDAKDEIDMCPLVGCRAIGDCAEHGTGGDRWPSSASSQRQTSRSVTAPRSSSATSRTGWPADAR